MEKTSYFGVGVTVKNASEGCFSELCPNIPRLSRAYLCVSKAFLLLFDEEEHHELCDESKSVESRLADRALDVMTQPLPDAVKDLAVSNKQLTDEYQRQQDELRRNQVFPPLYYYFRFRFNRRHYFGVTAF